MLSRCGIEIANVCRVNPVQIDHPSVGLPNRWCVRRHASDLLGVAQETFHAGTEQVCAKGLARGFYSHRQNSFLISSVRATFGNLFVKPNDPVQFSP